MSRKVYLFAFCALMVVSLFGCRGPKPATEPLERPDDLTYEKLNTAERFRKYESIGLKPFDSSDVVPLNVDADEEAETEQFVKGASRYLEEGFLDEMKDNYYKKFGIVESEEDAKDYDLVIEGSFIEVDRGSAAARFWGVGGQTRVQVKGTMTETATGKVVVEFRDFKIGTASIASIPLLETNCNEIGRNLSDFLEEVY